MKKTTCDSCLESIEINSQEITFDEDLQLFLLDCPVCGETIDVDEDKLTDSQIQQIKADPYMWDVDEDNNFEENEDGFE